MVAIDGPAGVGKTTLARRLAEALGARFVDSGALYRAVALAALERGVPSADEAALGRLASAIRVELSDEGVVTLDGRDVTRRIREGDVTSRVAEVAAAPAVRAIVGRIQRAVALGAGRAVVEGRDIGTVVFPDAVAKVFLDAGLPVRARRRLAQERPGAPEEPAAVRDVGDALEARDRRDRERPVAPLVPAEGAFRLDTTGMTPDEVLAAVLAHVRSRIPVAPPPSPPA